MTIGNLRGMRESSRLFGIPTYLFIFSILALIFTGIFKIYILGYTPAALTEIPKATGDITLFLFLRAFASGCTVLTGVEAVSDGIPNFRNPAQKNAKTVLMLLAFFVLIIFGGTSFLATMYHAVPSLDRTVISQISSQVFGNTFMFYMLQVTTAVILTMAANTAFSDLPLLLSLISRDSYAPRQFARRGKRLSFSNGIILLAMASSLLIIIFKGETHLLLPLYALGVFISFTLSQSGMFVRWIRTKSEGWKHKAVINGLGALITFSTVIIIGITKFKHGAWIVCILIPFLVILMLITKRHYIKVAKQLELSKYEIEKETQAVDDSEHIIVLIDTLNKASFKAINYARHISNNYKTIVAFNSSISEDAAVKLKAKWEEFDIDIPLIIKNSPYRDIMEPLIDFIESEEHESSPEDIITVVMPQFVVKHWWDNIFHGQSAMFIRQKLIHDRHIAIITVPYVLD
jgi:amino acid transporter